MNHGERSSSEDRVTPFDTVPDIPVSPMLHPETGNTIIPQWDHDDVAQNAIFDTLPATFASSLPRRDGGGSARKKVKMVAHVPFQSPSFQTLAKWPSHAPNLDIFSPECNYEPTNSSRTDILTRSRWADMLLFVADPIMMSRILSGDCTSRTLAIVRSWDASKPILVIPEMSADEWRNPITKRQLQKFRSKMPWITVLDPIIWDLPFGAEAPTQWRDVTWDWMGPEALVEILLQVVRSLWENGVAEKQKLLIGQSFSKLPSPNDYARNTLPSEILTMIFEYVGDWELAQAVGVYTALPTPAEWIPHLPVSDRPWTLEYTILTCSMAFVRTAIALKAPTSLSPLATKLIFKFSLTELLTYLSVEQKDLFWTSIGFTLPHRASVQFNKPEILEWWLRSPSSIKKDYGPEALDGASRNGFVPVLEWWLNSGLPLIYTERALESASSKGHIEVLEWWKKAVEVRAKTDAPIKLKVGKSIMSAAQSGRANTLAWWDQSGIPYGHEDGVARLVSAHGHVSCLQLWYDLKGSKIIFDNQVLVGPTKNGHADVLEWWKRSGLRVEYKPCDIEEAMEDSSVGGEREDAVRFWWEQNGLNLGVGTNEWMKVKCLQTD